MSIDLSNLSPRELGTLIATARKRQEQLVKRTPVAQVRSKLTRLARGEAHPLEELSGAAGPAPPPARTATAPSRAGRKLGKVAPKYRNPDNPRETWAGRGKQPRWLAAYTAKGRDLGEFLIPGTAKLTPKPVAGGRKRVVKKAKK